MHFHAKYVSTSVFGDGDYYQATFQAEQVRMTLTALIS
jgi:hypothetical protein